VLNWREGMSYCGCEQWTGGLFWTKQQNFKKIMGTTCIRLWL